MRFDLAALWRLVSANVPFSLPALTAAAGATLAALIVLYVVWPGSDDRTAEQVVVSGPVFTPVVLTPPAPSSAVKPNGYGGSPVARFDDDFAVTRAVQHRLKRAGCYDGPVNGTWSNPTRRGMAQFASLVNARLPVDRPDPVLLALLETHQQVACTPGCDDGAGPDCPGYSEPPARKEKVARADDERPVEKEPPAEVRKAPEPALSAEEESDPETAGPVLAAASAQVDAAHMDEAAALAAAGATAHEVTKPKPQRASRKYRKKNSFSRQVNRSFRKLQRSLNKLF